MFSEWITILLCVESARIPSCGEKVLSFNKLRGGGDSTYSLWSTDQAGNRHFHFLCLLILFFFLEKEEDSLKADIRILQEKIDQADPYEDLSLPAAQSQIKLLREINIMRRKFENILIARVKTSDRTGSSRSTSSPSKFAPQPHPLPRHLI
jgi:hypothetical protein